MNAFFVIGTLYTYIRNDEYPNQANMTRIQTILIGIFILMVVAVNIFLQSSSWRLPIENYINSKLEENSDWQIKIPNLEGNLLGTVMGKGMKFHHDNGSQIIFGDYSIKVNYLQSFFSTPTLSLLRVENILFSPIINTDSISTDNADSLDLDFPSKFNFIIQNISLGGVVEIPVNNVIKTMRHSSILSLIWIVFLVM